ncbi:MAG: hypothetical protein AB7S49_04010 [Arcobacter sp.]|uniref:hypothetical protein n=1 Tax=Arcobacter sp. TaxID=1872629 RepID=UPI003D03CC0B
MKLFIEIVQLIKRFFLFPKSLYLNYLKLKNENTQLRRDLVEVLRYIEKLENILHKIGYDLSKIDNFLINNTKNEFQNDIQDIEELGKNLNELFILKSKLDYQSKISNAVFIEKALCEHFTKTSKDYSLIKNAIRITKIRGI